MRSRRLPRLSRAAATAIVATVAVVVMGTPALAHVDLEVGDGQYTIAAGFRDEPAYLGLPNAVYLNVREYATGGMEPVEGLAATLEVEVTKDGQTRAFALEPTGEGEYEAVIVPSSLGDYTFHIFGTIGDVEVDESVTSGPSTFNSVGPLTAIEFPVQRPDAAVVQAQVAAAEAAAGTARTLAIAGVVVGALGLILGAVALARSGRARSAGAAPASPAAVADEPSGKLIR